jgi:hypothetical protein
MKGMEPLMDVTQFDRWTQIFTTTISRRRTLRGLLLTASPLAVALVLTRSEEPVEAKKKRKNKRKKRCKAGTKKCGASCIPAATCCSDVDCGAQEACIGGKCAVPCGQACDDLSGFCATSVGGAQVCAAKGLAGAECDAKPCIADIQCDATEFCGAAACPPIGGATNRCQPLRLP